LKEGKGMDDFIMAEDGEVEERGRQLPVPSSAPMDKQLIEAIAKDIGDETVAYIEVMYPRAITSTSSTFKTSIRNHIINEIMAAIGTQDANKMRERLEERKRFRRKWLKQYRDIRNGDVEVLKRNVEQMMGERQEGIE
jgi:hypothetical protein